MRWKKNCTTSCFTSILRACFLCVQDHLLYFFIAIVITNDDISDGNKRRRESPTAEHSITGCATVWASVHGPEPLNYTHRLSASRTIWTDILLTDNPTKGYVQKRNKQQPEIFCIFAHTLILMFGINRRCCCNKMRVWPLRIRKKFLLTHSCWVAFSTEMCRFTSNLMKNSNAIKSLKVRSLM